MTLDKSTEHPSDAKLGLKQSGNEFVKLDEKLTVHLIHHTHDDVGWLKTVDEYYSGVDNLMQRAEVMLILNTMIKHLLLDPVKKFSYVEMKFFTMWWDE